MQENKLQKIVALVGPTASGKTKLAVRLASRFGGEIVSADSRQVYRGLDIGSGKDLDEYFCRGKQIPYHLIDVVSSRTVFTVNDFQRRAYRAIADIDSRSKLPIIVGGSGLYVDAVVRGYDFGASHTKKEVALVRQKIAYWSDRKLLTQLQKKDPEVYDNIDRQNRRRVERALERSLLGGAPKGSKKPYQALWLGIETSGCDLRIRIEKRLKSRLNQGLIEEVERLHTQGVSWRRLDEFGLEYRFVAQYLQGMIDKQELLTLLATAIYQFSRRQLTWFRRNPDIKWIKSYTEAEKLVGEFLG
jgi:tRNA dimethylallyltransferase